ncbi:monocyte chemotactic protein 1B-like [Tenrec ecaudatus]|uniref:monocyte chemotactic protein 1B-like n=1 Tax=Tenrec ecaudatus TaxID=94439 RepID=UPI003F5963E2
MLSSTPTSMKGSVALLSLLLTAATVTSQGYARTVICCYSFIRQKIPVLMLVSYERTSHSDCPKEAVIFKTVQGRAVCADPTLKWVKDSIASLDRNPHPARP